MNMQAEILYLYKCSRNGCSGDVLHETPDYHLNHHVCPVCEHDLLPPRAVSGQNIVLRRTEKDLCNAVK